MPSQSQVSLHIREWSSPPCFSAAVGGKAGVLSHRGRSESSKESKNPVVDVGVRPEDPVVGPLVVAVPGAAPVPARVEHLVGKVLGSRAQSSSPGRGVNGLVAREEPGVWLVLVSTLRSVPGQAGSVLGGRGGEDEEGSKGCEGDDLHSDDFHFSRQTRLESLRLVGYW